MPSQVEEQSAGEAVPMRDLGAEVLARSVVSASGRGTEGIP